MGRKLENKHATPTEIALYQYTGMYLVEVSENSLRYAPVHFGDSTKDFPFVIDDIEDCMIEWDHAVLFDRTSEWIQFQGNGSWYDVDTLAMILHRAEELQFRRVYFKE